MIPPHLRSVIAKALDYDLLLGIAKHRGGNPQELPNLPAGLRVWAWSETTASTGRVLYYYMPVVGKATRTNWFAFGSESSRDTAVKQLVNRYAERLKGKQDAADARKQFKHSIEVGDVYYTSWGYEQTNIDFYEVVQVNPSGKMIVVREIQSTATGSLGSMTTKVYPVFGKYTGNPLRVIPKPSSNGEAVFKVDNHYAHMWDGRVLIQTSYH